MNKYSKNKSEYQKFIATFFMTLCLLAFIAQRGFAQSNQPPDPNSAWGEVFNSDGTLKSGVTDGGMVQQQANWMPNIPLIGPVEATYHVYYTPSGSTVVMPNAVTEFFMAANPSESGASSAASTYGTGGGLLDAVLGRVFGGGSLYIPSLGQQVSSDEFAQDLINGQANIWSLPLSTALNTLSLLYNPSVSDQGLYLMAFLYTPGQCASAPGGCSAAQLALLAPPTEATPPTPPICAAPKVIPGGISSGGSETWPPYPIVVGQDPNKTGVNLSFHASVAPTIYIYNEQVPITECESGPNGKGNYNCGGGTGHTVVTGYQCVQHRESFNECIASASGSISLSSASRDWILGQLQLYFPGAYIHKPYFGFNGGGCSWSASPTNVQIDDPGTWNVSITGRTSGTPVSPPRGFSGGGSSFDVALKEVMIVK